MAKGQQKSNREKKKPKQEKAKPAGRHIAVFRPAGEARLFIGQEIIAPVPYSPGRYTM